MNRTNNLIFKKTNLISVTYLQYTNNIYKIKCMQTKYKIKCIQTISINDYMQKKN